MSKKTKQLPGQMSIFDGQKIEGLYNQAKSLGKQVADELSEMQRTLEKMSMEEWISEENRLRRDLKECMVITGIHLTDVIKQLETATAIEFQMRIANSLK